MTLTVIFKVIGIGYNRYRAYLGYGYKRAIFLKILVWNILFSNKISNGDGQEIHMWKYLKTVDFINTKIIMFKVTFLPNRISTKNKKLHDLENEG